jgi:hypothetical protein
VIGCGVWCTIVIVCGCRVTAVGCVVDGDTIETENLYGGVGSRRGGFVPHFLKVL